jgi:hypothetical protein
MKLIRFIQHEEDECASHALLMPSVSRAEKNPDGLENLLINAQLTGISGMGGFNLEPRSINVLEFEKDILAQQIYFKLRAEKKRHQEERIYS